MIFIGDKILKLNKEQYIAVNHFNGPMLVLAGPGSGKTKVLTERIRVLIEDRGVKPDEILVITFSKKSALEMLNRFNSITKGVNYPVNFGTCHAVFFNILKNHYNYTVDNLISDKEKTKIIADVGYRLKITNYTQASWQSSMLSYISNFKNTHNRNFDQFISTIIEEEDKNNFQSVYESYVSLCRQDNKIDFDDMLLECYELLNKHESILRLWQSVYKYILVDEFQDINDIQYAILRLLAGDRRNLFCVGDDDQSIYAFRGAKPAIIRTFLHQFPGCRQVNLLVNYRCSRKIIEGADSLINHNEDRIARPIQKSPDFMGDGVVSFVSASNTIEQAQIVCETIKHLNKELRINYSDIAVLYRSEHCGKMFELVSSSQNIPVRIKHKIHNLFDIKEIKVIISYMKASLKIASRADVFSIINCPPRDISREAFCCYDGDIFKELFSYYDGVNDVNEVRNSITTLKTNLEYIRNLNAYGAFIYILRVIGLERYFKNGEYHFSCDYISLEEAIESVKDITREFCSINGFVDFVELGAHTDGGRSEKGAEDKGVNLLSVHSSKGLEYRAVIIVGLQEGLFPHKKGLHGKALEEERRLMYVGMTRAKEYLYLCSLGTEHGKQPSRFLSEIKTS